MGLGSELARFGAMLAAGFVAGGMNAIVGAGTLVTFPALVALGVPPLTANVSNTVGLLPGSAAGAYGYRHELAGRRAVVTRLGVLAALGGVTGAVLLLALPASAFEAIVPALIVLAAGLTAVQPWVARRVAARGPRPAHGGPVLAVGVFVTGVYGGYFGAAQGVILIALLGVFLGTDLQTANGVKNVLAGVANLVAAVIFIAVAPVDWAVALAVGVGATLGGTVGARYGRRLPQRTLRIIIVVVAVVAAVRLTVA